jgi:FkbM family methyltransferase
MLYIDPNEKPISSRWQHYYALMMDPKYRRKRYEIRKLWTEMARLRGLPRYAPATTELLGSPLVMSDSASFLSSWLQIFAHKIYRFIPSGTEVRILDCGANIGLATIYWKHLFPHARITAFEPDPLCFDLLRRNCESFALSDVQLFNCGVWSKSANLEFFSEGADGGHLRHLTLDRSPEFIVVDLVPLRDFLNEHIDMLKIDIEGSELEVLKSCSDALSNVDRIFVEVHCFTGQESPLGQILEILRKSGFQTHVQPELVSPRPFENRSSNCGMDQRINVFAFRS